MLFSASLVSLVLASVATAAPALPGGRTAAISDAPYSQTAATYKKAITCPNGIKGKKGGIVFLVHGTGSTGSESWAKGPYNLFLPTHGPGYDICWVDLPNRSLVDAQLSAEYVAYGISYLAPQSATKRVSVIGHSQGAGLNPQWALQFWPSNIPKVAAYVALAPDWHGTLESTLLGCSAANSGVGSCQPSVWQQTVGSKYLAAQNSPKAGSGATALVKTTALYTLTDDVIQPELPPLGPTSYLTGASVHAVQDLNFCGIAHVADHFSMIVDPAAYGFATIALAAGAKNQLPNIADFDKTYCTYFKDDALLNPANLLPLVQSIAADGLAVSSQVGATRSEPPLKSYVCKRGFATQCGA